MSDKIKYPAMRRELVSTLESLSDVDYQKKVWGNYLNDGRYDDFDLSIHFIYDDTKLSDDPNLTVGLFLYSEEEAKTMREVVSSLDALFDQYGLKLSDQEYICKPEWSRVLTSSKNALKMIGRDNLDS